MCSAMLGTGQENIQNFFCFSYDLSVSLTNLVLLKRFSMPSISANDYLTSAAAARARTMGAVSGNAEEAFVWIIPWCSDCHCASSEALGNYSFLASVSTVSLQEMKFS